MTELNILSFSFGGFRSLTVSCYYLLSSLLEIRVEQTIRNKNHFVSGSCRSQPTLENKPAEVKL